MSIIPSLAAWCSESVTRRGLLNPARISGGQCARISGKVGVRISGTRNSRRNAATEEHADGAAVRTGGQLAVWAAPAMNPTPQREFWNGPPERLREAFRMTKQKGDRTFAAVCEVWSHE